MGCSFRLYQMLVIIMKAGETVPATCQMDVVKGRYYFTFGEAQEESRSCKPGEVVHSCEAHVYSTPNNDGDANIESDWQP